MSGSHSIVRLSAYFNCKLYQNSHEPTDGVDGDDDGLRGEPGPGHVDLQLVDVPGEEGERQLQLLLQHVQTEVQVAEHGVAAP